MILNGEIESRLEGTIDAEMGTREIIVYVRDKTKVVRVNQKTVHRAVDFFGVLAVLLFSPETLKLVKEGPGFRRRFLDQAISRIDRRYLLELKEYRRIVEQRNRLLQLVRRGRAPRNVLRVWSEQLSRSGSRILQARYRYLADWAPICAEVFRTLAHKRGALEVLYRSSLVESPLRLETAISEMGDEAERFQRRLEQMESREIQAGASQIGPHRDDLVFAVDGHPIRGFASQGESRMLALSMTLGEAQVYHGSTGRNPVLLLDDVGSELDSRHKNFLNDYLNTVGQVFLTATEAGMPGERPPNTELFRVKKGDINVEKKEENM
jgi:DNA replication and repair protein RecF